MNAKTRKILRSVVPRFIRELRNNRLAMDMVRQRQIEKRLYCTLDGVIYAGPFAGLHYSSDACGSMLGPKLLGTYEKELHLVVKQIIAAEYAHIIDVGAAEGYYAVGLLKACPQSIVSAFESSSEGRKSLEAMAKRNGLNERLTVLGYCDVDALRDALSRQPKALIICDVEGFEKDLLDPILLPELRQTDILVEVHDFVDTTISSTLRERFSISHNISCFQSEHRNPGDIPTFDGFSSNEMMCAASERRPCVMEWFWMQTKDLHEHILN